MGIDDPGTDRGWNFHSDAEVLAMNPIDLNSQPFPHVNLPEVKRKLHQSVDTLAEGLRDVVDAIEDARGALLVTFIMLQIEKTLAWDKVHDENDVVPGRKCGRPIPCREHELSCYDDNEFRSSNYYSKK